MRKSQWIIVVALIFLLTACRTKDVTPQTDNSGNEMERTSGEQQTVVKKDVSDFALRFLKLENIPQNKIYSPLSISYGLKMLEEASTGNAKDQISNVIGGERITKYTSNSHMSLANALFVRKSFADAVKSTYEETLQQKYLAEVKTDSFQTVENINSWIDEKTLHQIPDFLFNIREEANFMLINALGIDMEWEKNFLERVDYLFNFEHENFSWRTIYEVSPHSFGDSQNLYSGMAIQAFINNYDIVQELGEETIRNTVHDAYREWINSEDDWIRKHYENASEEDIENEIEEFLGDLHTSGYLYELNRNYQAAESSTDFSLYVDDSVKVFAKDLKEYDGTTLQYVGIMPANTSLENYIDTMDSQTVNILLSQLKELKPTKFKEGVITKITGFIPKFQFDYELSLKEDLQTLGIRDVFEEGKANLTNLSDDENIFISDAIHKANIEFTQDGIKAAAAITLGGLGAGGSFDYLFDVPVEEIDMTFDHPFLFLIRDKETGDVWFAGTVYDPLLWDLEPEKDVELDHSGS